MLKKIKMRSQERLGGRDICTGCGRQIHSLPLAEQTVPWLWEQTRTAQPPFTADCVHCILKINLIEKAIKAPIDKLDLPSSAFPQGITCQSPISTHTAPLLSLPSDTAALDETTGLGRRTVGISRYSGSWPGNFVQSSTSHNGFVWYRPHWLNFQGHVQK